MAAVPKLRNRSNGNCAFFSSHVLICRRDHLTQVGEEGISTSQWAQGLDGWSKTCPSSVWLPGCQTRNGHERGQWSSVQACTTGWAKSSQTRAQTRQKWPTVGGKMIQIWNCHRVDEKFRSKRGSNCGRDIHECVQGGDARWRSKVNEATLTFGQMKFQLDRVFMRNADVCSTPATFVISRSVCAHPVAPGVTYPPFNDF